MSHGEFDGGWGEGERDLTEMEGGRSTGQETHTCNPSPRKDRELKANLSYTEKKRKINLYLEINETSL